MRKSVNSAKYVEEQANLLKSSGIPLSEVAWQTALLCVGWAYVFGGRGQYCTPANRRSAYKDKYPTIKTACKNFDGSGSCVGCKWYPNSERTRFFDCRGFTYWILLLIYGWKLMGAGATSQWNNADNWIAKGEISDGIPQNVIVCLFYYAKDKYGNRTSTLSHTGLYYNGQTVECSNNVQHSKTLNKKWEVWAVPNCCAEEYALNPAPNPAPNPEPAVGHPTLRRGSKGDAVKEMQTLLAGLGYDLGKYGIDGDYGQATEKAVKAFQKASGLAQDGVCGPKTWVALEGAEKPAEPTYAVMIPNLKKAEAEILLQEFPGATMAQEKM